MRRLIVRLFLFLLPFLVLLAFPAWVLFMAGEFASAEGILKRKQEAPPMLVGRAYSDLGGYMQQRAAQVYKPEILAIGTSRAMQFRADFFNRRFYNAGGGIRRFDDLRKFLGHLKPGAEPKLLIVGLDHNFFNPNWNLPPRDIYRGPNPWTEWLRILASKWPKIYLDWFKHKFKISDLAKPRADDVKRLGLTAIIYGSGQRNDGSYQWHWWEADADDL